MKKLRLALLFVLSFWLHTNLLAQVISEQEQAVIDQHFFGNTDYYLGYRMGQEGELETGRRFLRKATKTFKKQKNWPPYITASAMLMRTYVGASNYREGIKVGEKVEQTVIRKAPTLLQDLGVIQKMAGFIYQQAEAWNLAATAFEKELQLLISRYGTEPSFQLGLCYADLGFTHEKRGHYSLALDYFSSAKTVFQGLSNCPDCALQLIRLNEKIGFLKCHRGEELYNKGQKLEARPFYQAGVEAFLEGEHWPLYVQAVADLMNTYIGTRDQQKGLNRGQEAFQQLEDIRARFPNLAIDKIYHQLGRLYNDLEKPQLAIEAFEQEIVLLQKREVAEKSEVYATAYLELGIAYAQEEGSLVTAKDYFLKSASTLTALEDCLDCSKLLNDTYDKLGIVIGVIAKNELNFGNRLVARSQLEESLGYFRKSQNWLAYIECTMLLMETYLGTRDYQLGVAIGEKGIQTITEQAPAQLPSCHGIYQMQGLLHHGNFAAARSLQAYLQGLDLLQEKYGTDTSYYFAIAYNNIGACYSDLGQIDTAVWFFDKAIATYSLAKDCEDCRFDLSTAYGNRANMYFMEAEVEKGIAQLERAIDLSIAAEGQTSPKLIRKYLNLAFFYFRLEETSESMRYLKRIIYLIEQAQPLMDAPTTEWYAEAYALLGSNHLYLQHYEEARLAYEKAIALLNLAPEDHPIKILALTNLGRVYLEQKSLEQAALYLGQAQALYKTATATRKNLFYDYALGVELQMPTSILGRMTGQNQQAIKAHQQAFSILSEMGFSSSQLAVRIHLQLAQLYFQNSDLEAARTYCQQALLYACRTPSALGAEELPDVQQLFSIPEVYDILHLQAALLPQVEPSQPAGETQKLGLSRAIETLVLADEFHMENLKKASLLRGNQYRQLVEKSIRNYQQGIELAYDIFQVNAEQQSLEKAFYFAQQLKAQQLWLAILQSEAQSLGGLDQSLLEQEKQLLNEINRYEAKLFKARQEEDQKAIDRYENRLLFESRKRYQTFLQQLENKNPAYVEAKYKFRFEKSEIIQALLADKELLIEYVQIGSNLYIFTLGKRQALQLKKVDFWEETSARLSTFLSEVRSTSWVRRSSREKFIRNNHQLYRQYISPIEGQLEGRRRLIFIHDGLSYYIPFETLLASAEVLDDLTALDYLIKRFEISYHYSTRLFAATRRRKQVEAKGAYSFAPIYDQPQGPARSSHPDALKSTLEALSKNGQLAPLPESETEAQSIIHLMKTQGISGNRLSLRAAANEAALKKQLEKPYQFIHIAGHSFANTEYPKFSGIACYPPSEEHGEDGILYSGEIYALRTQTDLVTLSSCESALGRFDQGEGLQGLNRAFVFAGVPNVVSSLWKVYDKVSAQLMVDFYTEVLAGKDYAMALRKAKLNLLKQAETAAPHFWSPYVLIGR